MAAGVPILSTTALLACLLALPAAAQVTPLASAAAPPPAHLAHVEGGVDLIHEGVADRADSGMLLTDGDVVRTLNGRAEIVFADGTLLHLDHNTELELLSPVRLRLLNGRVSMRVSASAAPYAIDTHAAAVRLDPRGEYGVTADGRLSRLEVTVARGAAEIDDAGTRTIVRGGEMASILGAGGRVLLQQFNSARWDAFERWANDRANGFASAASARQLPSELRAYGPVLDSYGRWDYVAPYGNVWFPAVGVSWRPYYTGWWRQTRYGWTWIGHDPWSWPTHHYGRWGFTGAAWYWIPARTWGAAWVSWSFSPGYVGWCPLGWDGRAVIGYTHVSSWLRGGHRDHPAYWPHNPWRAWTVMPRDHFDGPSTSRRRSGAVRTHALDPDRLPDDARRSLAGFAVPREAVAAPLPAADTRVPSRSFDEPRRGNVRTPNAIPAPGAPSAPDTRMPSRAFDDPRRGAVRRAGAIPAPNAPAAPAAPDAPGTGSAPGASDAPGAPRYYTPPAYAVPRAPRPLESERAPERPAYERPRESTPAPPQRPTYERREGGRPARAERGESSARPPAAPSGGQVRSPRSAGRESGEARSQPQPSRGDGQSRGSSSGGAVRRRPQ
jgi:hypothetical protein